MIVAVPPHIRQIVANSASSSTAANHGTYRLHAVVWLYSSPLTGAPVAPSWTWNPFQCAARRLVSTKRLLPLFSCRGSLRKFDLVYSSRHGICATLPEDELFCKHGNTPNRQLFLRRLLSIGHAILAHLLSLQDKQATIILPSPAADGSLLPLPVPSPAPARQASAI